MISGSILDGVTGAYYSGKPGAEEFMPIDVSLEAKDLSKAKCFWELSQKVVGVRNI